MTDEGKLRIRMVADWDVQPDQHPTRYDAYKCGCEIHRSGGIVRVTYCHKHADVGNGLSVNMIMADEPTDKS